MLIHAYWTGPPDCPLETPAVCWTDRTVPSAYLELADSLKQYVLPVDHRRHRANVMRLGLLYEYGGMWVDHDLQILGDLDALPVAATAAHTAHLRCNCWMSFPAGHPELKRALDALADYRGVRQLRSPLVSGEWFLTELWSSSPIDRVLLYGDGAVINPDAAPLLVHKPHLSATRRPSEAAQCPPKPLVDFR